MAFRFVSLALPLFTAVNAISLNRRAADDTSPTDTGVTSTYTLTVARATIAPDGVSVPGFTVNGQFPGPQISANWGDFLSITVVNEIYGDDGATDGEEGTAMHWHGINQIGTPWFDGVPSVEQCPIAPGISNTYLFKADEHGTTWYHSHFSAQYSSGIQGPLIIYDNDVEPPTAGYDVDLGPIMVTDWYHDEYFTVLGKVFAPTDSPADAARPASDTILINGLGTYPCANITDGTPCNEDQPLSTFKFQSGLKYRLRLINTSASLFFQFAIDNHNFTVIANDFVPVVPYETEFVTLGVGQRTDVIVEATGDSSSAYYMRAFGAPGCSFNAQPEALAVVFYEDAGPDYPTWSPIEYPANPVCVNDPLELTVPAVAMAAVPVPDLTITLNITLQPNASSMNQWVFNSVAFLGDYNNPIFGQAVTGNFDFPPERNVYNTGSATSVRLVVYNFTPAPHPLHLHGHDFQVLQIGNGTWDGSIVNIDNPLRRDVQEIAAGGTTDNPTYVVFQWFQDNPGTWPFHCHIAWHVSTGMQINILERPEDLPAYTVPQSINDLCGSWADWQTTHVTDQIDSGVKRRKLTL